MRRVKSLLIKILVNALAIWVAAAVLNQGIHITGKGTDRIINFLILGAIFGLVNAFIKPLVKLFSLPAIVLTLGLFVFIINAAMLELVDLFSDRLKIDHFFWDAIFGAIIVSFVSMVLNQVLPDDD
jgi:putative membrane protein